MTTRKGKAKSDGTKTVSYSYGCGGYINKGKSVCQMNSIPQKELEQKVIDAVLEFYQPYLEKGGRGKLAHAIKEQTGFEKQYITEARQRAISEKERITGIINNLLDNITPANREHIDKRFNELETQRKQIEIRLEELERLNISQDEIDALVTEAMKFISGLEFTLKQGLPQEKLVALRQCIEKVHINKPANQITMLIHQMPTGKLNSVHEIEVRNLQ